MNYGHDATCYTYAWGRAQKRGDVIYCIMTEIGSTPDTAQMSQTRMRKYTMHFSCSAGLTAHSIHTASRGGSNLRPNASVQSAPLQCGRTMYVFSIFFEYSHL